MNNDKNESRVKMQKYLLLSIVSLLVAIFGGMFMLLPVVVIGGLSAVIFLIMFIASKPAKNVTGKS